MTYRSFLASRFAALALAGAFLFLTARPCRAGERPIAWNVDRSPPAASCPDATALAAAVARARGPESAREPRGPVEIDVAFARGEAGYTATVRARGATTGVRTLTDDSPTCAPLAEAVVATLAVLLDIAGDDAAPATTPAAQVATPPAPRLSLPPEREDDDQDPPLRLGIGVSGGYAHFHRSSTDPTTRDGVLAGIDVRVHPHREHGAVFGVSAGGAVFGPTVVILDAAYSFALTAPRRLGGVGTSAYAEVGPAFGIVSDAKPASDHTVLGGRASFAMDFHLTYVTVGAFVGYRGGVPLGGDDGWEGALSMGLRLGVVFDVGGGNAATP